MMMKNKICKILDGKYFWVFFAILGALIQTVVFLFTQDSYLSFISGLAGVFSVVLCSEKKHIRLLFLVILADNNICHNMFSGTIVGQISGECVLFHYNVGRPYYMEPKQERRESCATRNENTQLTNIVSL